MNSSVSKSIKFNITPNHYSEPTYKFPQNLDHSQELRRHVTPTVLVIYGVMANALFWVGLVMPFGYNAAPEVVMLNTYLVSMGLAMAFGGSLALLIIGYRSLAGGWRPLDYVAGLLNVTVLTYAVTLLMNFLYSAT